jgi:hypothetical protein
VVSSDGRTLERETGEPNFIRTAWVQQPLPHGRVSWVAVRLDSFVPWGDDTPAFGDAAPSDYNAHDTDVGVVVRDCEPAQLYGGWTRHRTGCVLSNTTVLGADVRPLAAGDVLVFKIDRTRPNAAAVTVRRRGDALPLLPRAELSVCDADEPVAMRTQRKQQKKQREKRQPQDHEESLQLHFVASLRYPDDRVTLLPPLPSDRDF